VNTDDKVYVIELGEDIRDKSPPEGAEFPTLPAADKASRGLKSPARRRERATLRRAKPQHANLPYPLLVLLAYVTGPLAVLLTPRGRRYLPWVSVAVGSTAAWAAVWLGREYLLQWMEHGRLMVPLAISLCILVVLAGFTAWAHGILMVIRDGGRGRGRLPGWTRKPGIVGLAGLAVPGLGLLLLGRGRRSVNAFWMLGPLFLDRAGWLWWLNRRAGVDGVPGPLMEQMLLIPAVVLLLGALVWIWQALDGIRLAGGSSSQAGRWQGGDIVALSLVISLVAFGILFDAGSVASDLDSFAVLLQHEGFRLIPFGLEMAAARLDPSRPVYVMRASEIADQMDRRAFAAGMRRDLAENWRPYVRMLQRDLLPAGTTPLAVLPLPIPETPPVAVEEEPEAASGGPVAEAPADGDGLASPADSSAVRP
jgi:hypothetical protein